VNLAEVYDLSSALELDWYEQIGLCKPGEAEKLLNDGDTTLGGRVPVNPSGGLGCFGEAVPAQAIAQVCELTWQLRGQAGERQVEGARLGVTVNQGLFGGRAAGDQGVQGEELSIGELAELELTALELRQKLLLGLRERLRPFAAHRRLHGIHRARRRGRGVADGLRGRRRFPACWLPVLAGLEGCQRLELAPLHLADQ
jgi:hypothetical protein